MTAQIEVVYFAHSMRDYNSLVADHAKACIRKHFPTAILFDPEDIDWQALEREHGRERTYEIVIARSDRVVVLEHLGHIGRGIHDEVRNALHDGKPVYVLRDGELTYVAGLTVVDREDWTIRYARVLTEKLETGTVTELQSGWANGCN